MQPTSHSTCTRRCAAKETRASSTRAGARADSRKCRKTKAFAAGRHFADACASEVVKPTPRRRARPLRGSAGDRQAARTEAAKAAHLGSIELEHPSGSVTRASRRSARSGSAAPPRCLPASPAIASQSAAHGVSASAAWQAPLLGDAWQDARQQRYRGRRRGAASPQPQSSSASGRPARLRSKTAAQQASAFEAAPFAFSVSVPVRPVLAAATRRPPSAC